MLTNRAYASPGWRAQDIIDRLRSFRQSGQHHFWPENVSLTDHRVFNSTFVHGHRQVTDIYLLGLAKASGGALATFDKSIPLGAVKGATSTTLLVVAPVRQQPLEKFKTNQTPSSKPRL